MNKTDPPKAKHPVPVHFDGLGLGDFVAQHGDLERVGVHVVAESGVQVPPRGALLHLVAVVESVLPAAQRGPSSCIVSSVTSVPYLRGAQNFLHKLFAEN